MGSFRFPRRLIAALALLLAATGSVVVAQVDGVDQGYSPVDSSGSYEVGGVQVDVTAKTAEAARYGGWRMAQRKAWQQLSRRLGGSGSSLSDGALDSIVSGIVIENEQIGPNRYIGRLGVLFSRAKAGSILGVSGQVSRSAPMLTIPVQWSAGTGQVFELGSEWQQAWARYRTGNSSIDYVRPTGTGPDSLLLNVGQVNRPDRGWWRTILDQYGASDVIVPIVSLYRQWPGGPVIGYFQARQGPDNRIIAQFSLRVENSDGLPILLDAGVKRMDDIYQAALRNGTLRVDPSLAYVPLVAAPDEDMEEESDTPTEIAQPTVTVREGAIISVQYDTPTVGAVAVTEAAMKGVPGVRSALTSSLALGGVSVMRVGYDGDPNAFRALLEQRGWLVQGSGTTLRIRRNGAPSAPIPPPEDNVTGG